MVAEEDARSSVRTRADVLSFALRLLAIALAVAAVAHLARYVLLVVNRSTPVPGWLERTTAFFVIAGGLAALGAFAYASVLFARWVIHLRIDAYGRHGLADPRRRWLVAILAAVPLVNVVGAGLLLREAAAMHDDLDVGVTRQRLARLWVAWVIVNVVALVAVAFRVVGMLSGSIQTGANGLAAVVLSSAISALFAWRLGERLQVVFGETQEDVVPARRWVAVA